MQYQKNVGRSTCENAVSARFRINPATIKASEAIDTIEAIEAIATIEAIEAIETMEAMESSNVKKNSLGSHAGVIHFGV